VDFGSNSCADEAKEINKISTRFVNIDFIFIAGQRLKYYWFPRGLDLIKVNHFYCPAIMSFNITGKIFQSAEGKVFAFLKRSGGKAGLGSAEGETRPAGSETERKNRRTLSWQKGRGFQFVVFFFLQIEISFLDKHSSSPVFG